MISWWRATPKAIVGRSSSSRRARSVTRAAAGPRDGCPAGYIACLCSATDSSTRNSLNSRETMTRSGLEMVSVTSVGHAGSPDWEGAPLRVSVMREQNFGRHCTELHVESARSLFSATPSARRRFHAFSRAAAFESMLAPFAGRERRANKEPDHAHDSNVASSASLW